MTPITYDDILKKTGEELTGDSKKDIALMEKHYGKIDGYTWHHNIDATMVLVPTEIHGPISHTGGASGYRNGDLP